MRREYRQNDLVSLVEFGKLNVNPVLMRDFEHRSIERSVGGLGRGVPIVLALTVDCRDGWMVRNLLSDVLELVSHVFVSLP